MVDSATLESRLRPFLDAQPSFMAGCVMQTERLLDEMDSMGSWPYPEITVSLANPNAIVLGWKTNGGKRVEVECQGASAVIDGARVGYGEAAALLASEVKPHSRG